MSKHKPVDMNPDLLQMPNHPANVMHQELHMQTESTSSKKEGGQQYSQMSAAVKSFSEVVQQAVQGFHAAFSGSMTGHVAAHADAFHCQCE